jgi:hypothetical protein
MEIKKFQSKLDIITVDETAESLGIPKSVLRNWDAKGIGPKFFQGYLRSDVNYFRALLESCQQEDAPAPTQTAGSLAS